MANKGKPVAEQIDGAIDVLERRLKLAGLNLDSVVKMDCLFKNIEDLNELPAVLKQRFKNGYPVRKAFTSEFIREGILFQLDAIAYKEK